MLSLILYITRYALKMICVRKHDISCHFLKRKVMPNTLAAKNIIIVAYLKSTYVATYDQPLNNEVSKYIFVFPFTYFVTRSILNENRDEINQHKQCYFGSNFSGYGGILLPNCWWDNTI